MIWPFNFKGDKLEINFIKNKTQNSGRSILENHIIYYGQVSSMLNYAMTQVGIK